MRPFCGHQNFGPNGLFAPAGATCQDQDQDSLLVKRRNDNHSPGPVIREKMYKTMKKMCIKSEAKIFFETCNQ